MTVLKPLLKFLEKKKEPKNVEPFKLAKSEKKNNMERQIEKNKPVKKKNHDNCTTIVNLVTLR